ncbi:MAG: transcriptional regulator [Betaproteobacteria bacterium]|nr:transcriptional regulator [Betaproteobacteria bacterium]
MYHYTESGLQNIWLLNGFKTHKVTDGIAVSIINIEGLHKLIGKSLARKAYLTGSEFRFLRKEMDFSQKRIAALVGRTEEAVSKWERLGHIPDSATRLLQAIYLESIDGDIKFRKLVEELAELDRVQQERLVFEDTLDGWRKAA